ncbi:MAG: 16S rRNA (cytidine(1402)-2'-O)-methyltransferase [Candidatus Lernaella stagnicola]|nr:16S rRNA (cytidine(1402)-2'-O)-methyltransferase [Candidatus Lernaella stagnicola]
MAAPGKLLLVATPIGNWDDTSARALAALRECDLVVAEDTRKAGVFLSHFQIDKPKLSFFEGNIPQRLPHILERLRDGQTIALVTDAGTPLISDPGYELVYRCLEEEIHVVALPGPCAAIIALQLSGLPPDRFIFDGFLPRKGSARRRRLESYLRMDGTLILYEAAKRTVGTLQDLHDVLGDVQAAVLREMTKIHEEALRGPLSYLIDELAERKLLGEVTIVARLPKAQVGEMADAVEHGRKLMREMGIKTKDAATAVALITGVDKKTLYKLLAEPS